MTTMNGKDRGGTLFTPAKGFFLWGSLKKENRFVCKATLPFYNWLLLIDWPSTMTEYSPQLGQHCPGILTDFSQATFWISQSYILWQVCLPDWHWHCWQYMLLLSADSFSTSALAPSLNNRPLIWQLRACSSGLTGTENDNDNDLTIMLMIVELSRTRAPSVKKFVCLCIQEIGVLTNRPNVVQLADAKYHT